MISNNARLRITFCSRYTDAMVGDPKTLFDLYQIEAQVRVACTSCNGTEVWELADLIKEVTANGGTTDWHSARYAMKCPQRCASPMIELLPLPFGKQRARQARYRQALVNLALQVLREAARRSNRETVGTIEVRLALHVLRPYLRRSTLLTEYWKAATIEPRHAWTSCNIPYRWIAQRLIDLGEPVDESNRP